MLFTKSFAGLFLAAHDLKVEWIVIKGVANFADGREPESWRQFASVMAASLTAHILSNPIVFENWPHYKGEYACSLVPSPVRAIRVSGEGLEPNSPDNDWKRGSVCRCHTSEGSMAVSNKREFHILLRISPFFPLYLVSRINHRETRFLSSATSGAQRILGKIACKVRSDGAELVFVKTSETVTRDKKRMANSVPSNDFRNNCGTHFGPISLPVSKVAGYNH